MTPGVQLTLLHANNLARLRIARAQLAHPSLEDYFNRYFIGALANEVEPEVWDRAIKVAEEMMQHDEMRQAGGRLFDGT